MQKELNAAAADGFKFAAGASRRTRTDIFVVMQKNRGGGTQDPRYQYKVLATTKGSTMRKDENGGAKLDHRAANRSCFWAE